jgi:MFS family permease
MRKPPEKSLWRNQAFVNLWAGQLVSLVGSQVTFLALPLVLVLTLHGSAWEMGLLGAFGTLPALVFALPGGVWVDRFEKRRIIMVCDLSRALLLLLIPLAVITGWLSLPLLLAVNFAVGIFDILFSIAYRSVLPGLLSRQELVEANSQLEVSRSAVQIVGPGLAGLLVQFLAAPFAIIVDAFSFLFSAFFFRRLPKVNKAAEIGPAAKPSLMGEIKKGFSVIHQDNVLFRLLISALIMNLFSHILDAILLLYATRDLGVAPGWFGLIFGAGSVGFMVGALTAKRVSRKLNMGKATILGLLVTATGDLCIVLAGGNMALIVLALLVGQFLFGIGVTNYNINQYSLRQSSAPGELLGRVNSLFTFVSQGAAPVGAVLGGVIGTLIGLRLTLGIAVLGEFTAGLVLLFSPLRKVKGIPAEPEPESEIDSTLTGKA